MSSSLDSDQLAMRWDFAAALASRLAHDLSNIFTGVNGFSELALLQLGDDHPTRGYVKDVFRSGQRGIELSNRMHLLRSCAAVHEGVTTVGAMVDQAEARLRSKLPPGLVIIKNIPADLPPVRVGGDPLYYIAAELIQNAVEAAGEQGRVQIDARPVSLTAGDTGSLYGRARPGRHVELRIVDSGPGVPDGLLDRVLMAPMGTARTGSRGLGLAIVFRVLYAHSGGFALGRAGERGAVARICLPVA